MFDSRQNVHTVLPSQENIPIVVASPYPADLNALRQCLQHHSDCTMSLCGSVRDAAEKTVQMGAAVVICERDLPDGTWKDMLLRMESMTNPPMILVVSRHADDSLWAEVLNLGGYDVLLKPFERSEVTRVIAMATRHWVSTHDLSRTSPSARAPQ